MTYTPQNLDVYTAAFAGAIAGAGVPSGAFITDPVLGDYAPVSTIATVFAQAVDTAWGATVANTYDIEAITDAACNLFVRGAGYPVSGVVTTQGNWTTVAIALVALVRQGDVAATAGGIAFPPLGGSFTNLSNVVFIDGGTTVSLGQQTGNIERPFSTLQQLNTGLPHGGTALITPGDYTSSGALALTVAAPILLANQAGNVPTFIGQLEVLCHNITAVSSLGLQNIYLQGTVTASTLSVIGGVAASKLTASSYIRAEGVQFGGLTGVIDCGGAECVDCRFDAATNRTVVTASISASFRRCIFSPSPGITETISVASGIPLSFENCEFSLQFGASTPIIEFTGAPGNLVHFDESSMASFIAAGGTLVNCDATSLNLPALTNIYYLDVSAEGPLGDNTGHIEKPLVTLSQLAALPGSSTMLIVPGDYSGDPVAFLASSIALSNASCLDHNQIGGTNGINVVLPEISCVGGDLLVQGCACSAGIGQTNVITLKQCNIAIKAICDFIFAEDTLFLSSPVTLVSRGDFTNCEYHTAIPGNAIVQADNLCALTFRNCTFRAGDNPVIVFTSGTNDVDFDETSLISFLAAGGTIQFGQYKPIAGPLSGTASFGPTTLNPGQTTVASLVLPDVFSPDILAIADVVTSTKPGAFIISATYVAITHTLEIYADNYTGAPIILTDAVTLRWKMCAP